MKSERESAPTNDHVIAGKENGVAEPRKKLPVTLLSGFLGAGKTTVLRHILQNKQDVRVALIVNDMAEINIDAGEVESSKLIQREEKLVKMQNGCICCTLREDLLEEVLKLGKEGAYDYLVIESTGISEPMQVAETFTFDTQTKELLSDVARLDTCVTVIDALHFFSYFDDGRCLNEKFDDVGEEDQRNISDLHVDQIEFSNVVILNKADLVSESTLAQIKRAVSRLNPEAAILTTSHGRVPLKSIINTGLFNMEKAALSPGWLQELRGSHVPETEEYGVRSFVYRARRPFHPERLFSFLTQVFFLQQLVMQPHDEHHRHDEEGEAPDALAMGVEATVDNVPGTEGAVEAIPVDCTVSTNDAPRDGNKAEESHQDKSDVKHTEDLGDGGSDATRKGEQEETVAALEGAESDEVPAAAPEGAESDENPTADTVAIGDRERAVAEHMASIKESFGHVLRAKGFMWVAGRDALMGEMSVSGIVCTMRPLAPWFVSIPQDLWPQEGREAILKNYADDGSVIGDRRQEIVFIGVDLKDSAIVEALDDCVLTEDEFSRYIAESLEFEDQAAPATQWRNLGA